jgi:hypothetical protein
MSKGLKQLPEKATSLVAIGVALAKGEKWAKRAGRSKVRGDGGVYKLVVRGKKGFAVTFGSDPNLVHQMNNANQQSSGEIRHLERKVADAGVLVGRIQGEIDRDPHVKPMLEGEFDGAMGVRVELEQKIEAVELSIDSHNASKPEGETALEQWKETLEGLQARHKELNRQMRELPEPATLEPHESPGQAEAKRQQRLKGRMEAAERDMAFHQEKLAKKRKEMGIGVAVPSVEAWVWRFSAKGVLASSEAQVPIAAAEPAVNRSEVSLLGSSLLKDPVVLPDGEVRLVDFVADAQHSTGLTLAEWNQLEQSERDELLVAHIEGLGGDVAANQLAVEVLPDKKPETAPSQPPPAPKRTTAKRAKPGEGPNAKPKAKKKPAAKKKATVKKK